jgi:hypothetical protein
VISGVAHETNCSDCIPRFALYHCVVRGIEATVRTRWSRDLICAAGLEDIFLVYWRLMGLKNFGMLLVRMDIVS